MIKLFHSYQYIPNSSKIKFNKEKQILENEIGEFILGLIGIPKIPELNLIIEKSLVSKRLSKKSSYKNHTKHNIKLFIILDKKVLNTYLSNQISNRDKQYLVDILKKNYVQYDLDYNLFDLICVKLFKNNTPSKVLTLSKNLNITIGDFMINIFDKKITPLDNEVIKNKITILLKGGILLSDMNASSRYKLLTLDFIEKDYKNVNSTRLLILETELEFASWTTLLENKHINWIRITSNIQSLSKKLVPNTIYIINQNELSSKEVLSKESKLDLFEHIFMISNNPNIKIVNNTNSYIWYIMNTPNKLTIQKIIDIVNHNLKDKLDNRLLYNIDNLYQLSKVVTPLFNYSKTNKIHSSNIITLDTKLHNFINNSEKIIFTDSSSSSYSYSSSSSNNYSDHSDHINKISRSTYCNVCLSNKSTYIKSECNHIYCLECYIEHLFFKLKDTPKNVSCGFCRQNIKNTTLNLYSDKFKYPFFKELSKRVDKYKRIVIYSNNQKRMLFFKNFVKYYKTKEIITYSNMYNLLNENFDNSLLIYDNISNNTFNYIINQLDITNYIFIE